MANGLDDRIFDQSDPVIRHAVNSLKCISLIISHILMLIAFWILGTDVWIYIAIILVFQVVRLFANIASLGERLNGEDASSKGSGATVDDFR